MHYFFIYKTTNTINGKYYIGKHETDNMDDGYLGSGIQLNRAVKKYGKKQFVREILYYCNNSEELSSLESKIVDEEIVLDPLSYNIALGGKGGCIVLKEHHPLRDAVLDKMRKTVRSEEHRNKLSEQTKKLHETKRVGMYGKKQTQKQKDTVSEMMRGKKKTTETVEKMKMSISKTFADPNYVHPNRGRQREDAKQLVKKIHSESHVCPHCGTNMIGPNYFRYHGDKCKKMA